MEQVLKNREYRKWTEIGVERELDSFQTEKEKCNVTQENRSNP